MQRIKGQLTDRNKIRKQAKIEQQNGRYKPKYIKYKWTKESD